MGKMIEKLDRAVFLNGYIDFGYLDSHLVTFFSRDIGLNSISLYNFSLDDDHFYYCHPGTINSFKLMVWYHKYKQHKSSKKRYVKNYHL